MKKATRFLAVISVLFLALGIYGGKAYRSAEDAAVNCHTMQTLLSDGYVMKSCVVQPIYYFVAPTGTYQWGQIETVLTGQGAYEEEVVYVTCYVDARDGNLGMKFRETHNHVVKAL